MASKQMLNVYPDKVRVYPGKVSSVKVIEGYMNKYSCSKSEAADRLISLGLQTLGEKEIEELRIRGEQNRKDC